MVSDSLVLTIIGRDKPGLVERLSETVAEHGGNWLESRMAHLGGRFAGILRVDVPEARAQALGIALTALEAHGLRLVVESGLVASLAGEGRLLQMELVGNDRPGIIREVSQALASHGVNVDALQTKCESAPMAGGMLFKATAELRLPASVSLEALREELERIADDLIVDVALDEFSAKD